VYVLNDPYHGGTHLPDVTVVTPVYMDIGEADPSPPSPSGGSRDGGLFPVTLRTASPHPDPPQRGREQAHVLRRLTRPPCDIGGITPGSMPPFSTRIEERACRSTTSSWSKPAGCASARCWTCCAAAASVAQPRANIADLKAQIAANEKGVQELRKMVAQFGLDAVRAYMGHVQDNAEESVRRVITKLKNGSFTLPLDNGRGASVSTSASTRPSAAR